MIRRTMLFRALLGVGLLGMVSYVSASEIKIDNQDAGTGQGLDDPTPASPVGGNPGATRGEQARIVFQFAADLWGAVLKSDVPITVSASFAKLSCTATAGTLGSAGATYIFGFEDPAPAGALANTWYHSALFDALAGEDAAPGGADIRARFNGALGSAGCLEGSSWYFGLDGKQPVGSIDFLNVVLHEMAHGLGFSGFGSLTTGQPLSGLPDIYSTFVFDNSRQKSWYAMTPAERVASAVNDGHLVFTGPNVKAEAPLALTPPLLLRVSAPAPAAGDYAIEQAAFGPVASIGNFKGGIVAAVTGTNAEGCTPFDNAAAVAGHLALVVRGTCAFTDKVDNAQRAGATGVIIANNQAGTIVPGGTPLDAVNYPGDLGKPGRWQHVESQPGWPHRWTRAGLVIGRCGRRRQCAAVRSDRTGSGFVVLALRHPTDPERLDGVRDQFGSDRPDQCRSHARAIQGRGLAAQ